MLIITILVDNIHFDEIKKKSRHTPTPILILILCHRTDSKGLKHK